MKVVLKVKFEAHRWFKNGDHPKDEVTYSPDAVETEGKFITRFRRPDVDGNERCTYCGSMFQDHGYLEEKKQIVCPGDWLVTDFFGATDVFHHANFMFNFEEVKP